MDISHRPRCRTGRLARGVLSKVNICFARTTCSYICYGSDTLRIERSAARECMSVWIGRWLRAQEDNLTTAGVANQGAALRRPTLGPHWISFLPTLRVLAPNVRPRYSQTIPMASQTKRPKHPPLLLQMRASCPSRDAWCEKPRAWG